MTAPKQGFPWGGGAEDLLHVLGVVGDDEPLLLSSVNPTHHNNPIILIQSSGPANEDGLRGEESVGELLLDCLSCVYVHLVGGGLNMLVGNFLVYLHHGPIQLEDIVREVAKPWKIG